MISTLKQPLKPIETIDEAQEIMLVDKKGNHYELNDQQRAYLNSLS